MFFRKSNPAHSLLRKAACIFTVITFILGSVTAPEAMAQPTSLILPAPGTMVPTTADFNPVLIRGVNLVPGNPMLFDFIVDPGDSGLEGEAFEIETRKLIKYFLASLTVPQEEMWVNLSPYEQNRIIPETFGKTEMGRDLLAQDYMLKQLTSSLMYPENDLGAEFWQKVYRRAEEHFGTTDIPLDTFNKIWIVPETATVYEHSRGAFVVYAKLKVMLEQDYIALEANQGRTTHGVGDVRAEDMRSFKDLSIPVIREILIPEIEREVNEGATFANLRQIHNAMILARWYKENLKESLLGQVYADRGKVEGVDTGDPLANQQVYEQYVAAFKKGVFNMITEEYNPSTQQIIPRKYFSGGVTTSGLKIETVTPAQVPGLPPNTRVVRAGIEPLGGDPAKNKSPSTIKKLFFTGLITLSTICGGAGCVSLQPMNWNTTAVTNEVSLSPAERDTYKLALTEIVNNPRLKNLPREEMHKSAMREVHELRASKLREDIHKKEMAEQAKKGHTGIVKIMSDLEHYFKENSPSLGSNKIEIIDTFYKLSSPEEQKIILSLDPYKSSLIPPNIHKALNAPPYWNPSKANKAKELLELLNTLRSVKDLPKLPTPDPDAAMTAEAVKSELANTPTPTGGIDFNPDIMRIGIQHSGQRFDMLPPTLEQINEFMDVNGFVPIILNVTPVTNLPLLLGMADTRQDPEPNHADQIRPVKPAGNQIRQFIN